MNTGRNNQQKTQNGPPGGGKSVSPTPAELNPLVALFGGGRYDEVERQAHRLLARYPESGFLWKALGAALLAQRKDALSALKKAAEWLPGDAETHENLGNALQEAGDLDAAVASYRRALAIRPDAADVHTGLGNALYDLGQLDEAEASFRRALEIDPRLAKAHRNLGAVLQAQGRLDEGIAHYRQSRLINPDYVDSFSNLLFALNYRRDLGMEEIFRAAREYEAQIGAPLRRHWRAHDNDRTRDRRLRIGYVSPDFRQHAVASFAEPILANHDRSQVEIFCYAELRKEDEITNRFRRLADHWHPTAGLGDDAVADMVRSHKIDILVDLAGHSAKNRLLVFARKPAPIQITYLGYPATTGLSAMDYRITDRYVDPEGVADPFYSETLLRLPHSLCCYRPPAGMPDVTPLPALSRGYVTFGSFNNFNKIDDLTIALWANLLRALPASRLLMVTVPQGEGRQRLLRAFADLGVEAERLELHGMLPGPEFRRKFCDVDLALDPVSLSGGTTTCESLWMGVPTIAFVGDRCARRVSYSFLSTAGLQDFAASSPEQYIHIASHLATSLPLLAEIRAGLRAHVAASPLADEVGFARDLEAVYRDVWERWCGQEG